MFHGMQRGFNGRRDGSTPLGFRPGGRVGVWRWRTIRRPRECRMCGAEIDAPGRAWLKGEWPRMVVVCGGCTGLIFREGGD